MKINLHTSAGWDGSSALRRGTKTPFCDGFDRFLIEPQAGTGDDSHVCGVTGLIHFDGQDHSSLKFRATRFFGELGFDLED